MLHTIKRIIARILSKPEPVNFTRKKITELPSTEYAREVLRDLYKGDAESLQAIENAPIDTKPPEAPRTRPNQAVMRGNPLHMAPESRKKTIRTLAEYHGYVEEAAKDKSLLIFNMPGVQINVWWTTMTVGTCIDHPTKGKTQLFRKGVDFALLDKLLENPRQHTGKGYYEK